MVCSSLHNNKSRGHQNAVSSVRITTSSPWIPFRCHRDSTQHGRRQVRCLLWPRAGPDRPDRTGPLPGLAPGLAGPVSAALAGGTTTQQRALASHSTLTASLITHLTR